jgi:hypothetical protein
MFERSKMGWPWLAGIFFIFVLLSLADFLLTYQLVENGQGDVLESNPLANILLSQYGWAGIGFFKLAMVILIGILILIISRKRLRTAEMILVFACGVQAGVVANSFLLGRVASGNNYSYARNIRFDRVIPENTSFLFLTMPSVQRELNLTDGYTQAIQNQMNVRRDLVMKFGHLSDPEWEQKIREMMNGENHYLKKLTLGQEIRLQQIILQMRGPMAFLEKEIIDSLQLSTDQQETIQMIIENPYKKVALSDPRGRKTRPGRGQTVEGNLHSLDQILQILTQGQKTRWQEMIGDPMLVPGEDPNFFHSRKMLVE